MSWSLVFVVNSILLGVGIGGMTEVVELGDELGELGELGLGGG